MQFAVPVPGVCLQLATPVQVSWQVGAWPQSCWVEVASVPVSWQEPLAQFWVHRPPEPHVSWHSLAPLQFTVQVEFWQFV